MANFKKDILLTGAGFSANFGGLLAREMWSKILNNPKIETLPAIKELLKSDFDFESVYSNVKRSGSFTAPDKLTFQDVVMESYASMDDALKGYGLSGQDPFGVYIGGVTKFLGSFAGRAEEKGVHFTLNQDLFLERQTQIVPLGLPMYQYRDYHAAIQSRQVDARQKIPLPDSAFLDNFKEKHFEATGDFCYIKLHGSIGWMSSDGQSQMIVGTNKLEDINKEPLLKWYFELFKEAISRKGVRLFVSGYSFRDKHVNECLLKAIDEHGLKIYVISPEDPERFKNRMEGRPEQVATWEVSENVKIWKAVSGYFPYRLRDIFPSDQSNTHIRSDLEKTLGVRF